MAEWKATPEQQAAAQDRGGALLVAAAAGSGKTKTIAWLALCLIRHVAEDGQKTSTPSSSSPTAPPWTPTCARTCR